ncbi:MAG: iron ABC transporter permease [Sulfurimonas sp. RIFCSPHIGHO2_12_FULL_36_9]|nr:MAG: iron ABC transporter permease [Sulfurimonas sp. RIFCSPHIGHO2_12_FULL_36_9]OHE04591.1 MAG: iron ABC transporter permease [Sulfurimonas sp. RIFCSPLOWO2_12_FULL_36_74]
MKYIFIILSLFLLLIAPFFGQIDIDMSKINLLSSIEYKLFWDLRVPRVVVAFFTGALLALSGLIFQSIFRNPMSTPFTLGVASGATLGTAFAIVFGLVSFTAVFGFLGALFTIIVLFTITSRLKAYETSSLLLIGIALSFFYSAALMILFYISDETQSYEIVRFTMGSLDVVGFMQTLPVAVAAILLLLVTLKYKREIKLLLTSYDNAFLKGIEVKKVNTILLISVSIAIGVAVSITGPIGFVGLIVPHILKVVSKKSADKLIVPTFFYGGIFLVLCDLISRNLGTASDVPIGVVTSFLGGPFFIYLLVRRKRV